MLGKQTLKLKKFLNTCPCCPDDGYFDEESHEIEEDREVPFGSMYDDVGGYYADNAIRTSKYTVWSFFPKNLFEQCIRFTNAYFIILICLMLLGTPNTDLFVSPSTPYGTAITLAALMAFTMVVAALDDVQRCAADREMNGRRTLLHRGGNFREMEWSDVEVGDVVLISKGEELPADIAMMACSGEDGEAYVSTMNLDGETNLKIKRAPGTVQDRLLSRGGNPDTVASALEGIGGQINCEGPSKNIEDWNGMIEMQGNQVSLDIDNLLLRGTSLENTDWAVGVTVYTGDDTRIRRNAEDPKYKFSNIDRYINLSVLIVLIVQIIISIISAIIFAIWESDFEDYWYIYPEGSDIKDWVVLPPVVAFFLTYFILYSNLMPIALLASMEFVNVIQKLFIQHDLNMYDRQLDVRAKVRTANLCQEIGQVSYIFSDKTGTLTRNQMELKLVSVGGRVFGKVTPDPGFQAADECRQAGQDEFWETIATCHSVITSHDSHGNKKFEAQSPDETALVDTARMVGWDFQDRKHGKMYLNTPRGQKEYTVLANNAFTSDRKRSSVLLQSGGEYMLVAKGADDVMIQRASGGGDSIRKDLYDFSTKGLRTLVIAKRRVDAGEAQSFLQEYNNAKVSVHGRKELEKQAADRIEHGWNILGCTGVEDKLQDNVQETIVSIRRAGINLWVLTGDKLETAKNIGFSTRVLSNEMDILTFADNGPDLVPSIRSAISRTEMDKAKGQTAAMLITGNVLTELMSYEDELLELARNCAVVIACRVNPSQKANMVSMVRKGITPRPVTLAIGDGANDVPMIMKAQVGVGIAGKEGRQAVNSADFAITQFQFLQRLLLIHGRWNYRRVAKLIIYTYWKSVLVTYLLFFYGFYSGFSATAVFTGLLWLSYSWWTSAGIVAVACTDQDLTEEECLRYPGLYDTGRLALDFNALKVVEMLISSFVHSVIIFFVFVAAAPAMEAVGKGDFVTWGSAMYVGLLINVTWRLVHITTTWNWAVALAEFLPIVIFILFLALYSGWQWWIPFFDSWWMNFYFVGFQMANQWMFWILIFTLPLLAGTLDTFREFLILQFLPDRRDIIHEEMSKEVPDVENIQALEEENFLNDTPQDMRDKSMPQRGYPGNFKPTVTYFPTGGYGAPSPYMTGYPQGQSFNMYMMRGMIEDDDSEETGFVERSHSAGSSSDEENNYPWDADIIQQTIPSTQCMNSWQQSICCACCSTVILLIFGLIVLLFSLSVDEIVVQYNGDERRPYGVHEDSFTYQKCEPSGFNTTTCCVPLVADKDLSEPVHINYVLDPYYQNYIFYQISNLWREQHGNAAYPFWDDDNLREAYCKPDESREVKTTDSLGQEQTQKLYPCGLHTFSFFNDSFWLPGKVVDTDDIFWPSDEDVVKNPDFYPDDPDFLFVNERFPTIISTDEGVDNPHYLVWIRLSALNYVYKRYGTINDKISKGENLTVCINASYPLDEKKYIYFTEVTGLGARNDALGIVLLVCSALAAVATCLMGCILLLCNRPAGKPRFKDGTREVLFRKAQAGHEESSNICGARSDASSSDEE